MILEELGLVNFRQFYGEQSLEFAPGGTRNVTMVFGANGAGKSALLSALTWCLYGKMPPALEDPDRVICQRAWQEATPEERVEASVRLRFRHDDGKTYEVERSVVEFKDDRPESPQTKLGSPRVTITDSGGETLPAVANPSDLIQQILPLELHRYFFFDGERMEDLVKKHDDPQKEKKRAAEFAEATRKLLGLELIERALDHTEEARKQFHKEVTKSAPEKVRAEMERIQNRIDKIHEDIETNTGAIVHQKDRLMAFESERAAVEDQLRRNEQSHAYQTQLDEAERRRKDIENRLSKALEEQRLLISRSGVLAFTGQLTGLVTKRFANIRERGQIPTPIKRQFVQDLLDDAKCICGTELKPGTRSWSEVEVWLQRAVAQGAEESWTKISAYALNFDQDREQLFLDLRRLVASIADLRLEKSQVTDGISELQTLLKGVDSSEIKDLAIRQQDLAAEILRTHKEIGVLERSIQDLEQDLAQEQRNFHNTVKIADLANTAWRQLEAITGVRNFFADLLAIKTADTRREIDRLVKEVFQRIAYKDYIPELDDKFRLTLYRSDGGGSVPVAKSTGENQILSLSFVGAVAEYAKRIGGQDRSQTSIFTGFGGGTFPIVMDSPFGALDENYRRPIAQAVPKLAEQVVILVSKSQGLGEVLEEVTPRTGRRYVILYHSTKPDLEPETIELDRHQYPYIVPSTIEWAELKEI